MHITLLKLGGSLITDKQTAYKALEERIDDIARQINSAVKNNSELNIILGTGAGSFAHQSAKKYGTMNGFNDDTGKYGACVVHHDAMRLNQIVMSALIEMQIPAFSMQPSAMMVSKLPISNDQFPILDQLLMKKIIPVVYGDVIIDVEKGSTIYSTDTIFKIIAKYFAQLDHEVTIIHAGDYPGVLDEKQEIIPTINIDTYPSIAPSIKQSFSTDVTGGMKLKVEEMLELTKQGITSHIIDGTESEAIFKALNGAFSGTTISPS